jgi:hypothetical protein
MTFRHFYEEKDLYSESTYLTPLSMPAPPGAIEAIRNWGKNRSPIEDTLDIQALNGPKVLSPDAEKILGLQDFNDDNPNIIRGED